MRPIDRNPIVVGQPNWTPLETVLPPRECQHFMHIGRAGEIELYKHRWTRRYLNISSDGRRFFRQIDDGYVEISKVEALEHVRN
jgi:hypothetical protein